MKDQKIVKSSKTRQKKIKADTIVSIVLDMSGSMSRLADATREGLNTYLDSLREDNKNTDEVLVSLTVFDSDMDYSKGYGDDAIIPRIKTIFNLEPLSKVPVITEEHYKPEGGTPLYDAIGAVVERTDEALKGVKGNPDVLLVIITDGYNNTSRKLSSNDAKVLIEHKQGKGWTPIYLGANQDAWAVSEKLGISSGSIKTYSANVAGVRDDVFKSLGSRTQAHRMAKCAVYASANADARGLAGSYTTTDFFAGSDDNLEEMLEGMTASASLGGEETKEDDKDES